MTTGQDILIETLAKSAALHEPMRDPFARYWPAVCALRRRFADEGVGYDGGGSKERQRSLDDAVAAGLIDRHVGKTRTVGCRLTIAGLVEAWRLIGVAAGDAVAVADEVARRGPGGRWVSEVEFAGGGVGWGDGRVDELRIVQRFHAPALVVGLIESNCSTRGHCAYRRTAMPIPGELLDLADQDDPKPDTLAVRRYSRAYDEFIRWLNGQSAESVDARGEIGMIPIPLADLTRKVSTADV